MFTILSSRLCLIRQQQYYYQLYKQCSIRLLHKSHYEILNLKSDCTEKDIRDAFIKLSKENHPDTSNHINEKSSAKFTQIMEAYRILSKPDTRSIYDTELTIGINRTTGGVASNRNSDFDFNTANRYADDDPNKYYGVDGVKKVSNAYILIAIFLFAAIGVLAQTIAIRSSFTFKRKQLDETSKIAGRSHSTVRADAEKYGNQEQLKRMLGRIAADDPYK